MSERIFGGVLLLVSLAGIWIGWDLQAPMSYEPVGPRAFPLLVLFLLGISAIALILEKKGETVWAPPPVLRDPRCQCGHELHLHLHLHRTSGRAPA